MKRIWVEPGVYLVLALWVLLIPFSWLVGAVFAAAFHEICHAAMILLLGGEIWEVRIGISGASMEAALEGRGREFLAALAGPLGSFSLLCVCNVFPELAVCGVVQGGFNLLPIYPMDGGRMLRCGLELCVPEIAEQTVEKMERIVGMGIVLLLVWGIFQLFSWPAGVFLTGMALLRGFARKRPCKDGQIRVQ